MTCDTTERDLNMLKPMFLIIGIFACACGHSTNVTVSNEATTIVSPQDFALDTVVGLLRSGVSDGPTLEAKINDPASGINNVDIDKDGKVDFVRVVEAEIPSGKKMELIAHASGGAAPDVTIAAIKFTQADNGVDTEAGYAPLIDPGGRYYYHDHLLADMLFARWLFMPSRPVYFAPVPYGYSYRSRLTPSTFTSTRSTFTRTTRVSPIVSQPRPSSFNAGRLTSPPRPAVRAPSTTFGQAAQGTSPFRVDSRPKSGATGFGSSPSISRPASPAPRSPTPSVRSTPSSPSRGRSR